MSLTISPEARAYVAEHHAAAVTLRASPRHGCCGGTVLLPVVEPGAPEDTERWACIQVDGVSVYLEDGIDLPPETVIQIGVELARSGDLDHPDDVMFLSLGELKAFAAYGYPATPAHDWKPLIRERRASYDREMLRRQLPRLFLSDGRAFYEGIANPDPSGASLSGSPVSPGTAEGRVRVVLDPRNAGMRPGEILVCPGTDPSWTPLFLSAGGLIMEMGGMMTHGAVVAREYGIPAIVGLDQATRRLVTGKRIRMDGSTGRVDLLDSGPESSLEKEPSAP